MEMLAVNMNDLQNLFNIESQYNLLIRLLREDIGFVSYFNVNPDLHPVPLLSFLFSSVRTVV